MCRGQCTLCMHGECGRSLGVCVGVYGRAGDVGRNRVAAPEQVVPKGTQRTYALYCFVFDSL